MPKAVDVNPLKWTRKIVLYDDNEYSVVWGYYDNSDNRCLGVRWNDGYPSQGGNPLFYIEPELTTEPILLAILSKLSNSNTPERNAYIENILIALKEYRNTI